MNRPSKKKYIFITGGVTSSLGKGLAAASLASLLERRGIRLAMLKMDPYLNVDPGTMSPTQHGEVFVTHDGAETDLDLGHYERFTQLQLSRKNNFTTGQVYLRVIESEREGVYLGKTVQVVPHITNEIKRRIHQAAESCDLLVSEIGGTVGDIEGLPFLEAIRQFAQDVGPENVLFLHLVLVPYLSAAGELKSKPAQHSVKELRSIGLFPQIILCRSERPIDDEILNKLSLFCNVNKGNVFQNPDMDSIYKVPLEFHRQGLGQRVCELLGIWAPRPKMDDLEAVVFNLENPVGEVCIGIVGKYTELIESYKSLNEALRHGSIAHRAKLRLDFIDSEELEGLSDKQIQTRFAQVDGLLVPGGFGKRGTEGKISAIKHARTTGLPFLGICLGLQMAIVEFARNVAGMNDAVSEEFSKNGEMVIHFMKSQRNLESKGGNMRLGAYSCQLQAKSLAHKIYRKSEIMERHRHRLEVNNSFVQPLSNKGLVFSGINPDLNLVEIIELPEHPFFIACQFHPEFQSRPFSPHPLFSAFIKRSFLKESVSMIPDKTQTSLDL